MPLVYEQDFTVCDYECDPWGRFSPGASLRRAQELGRLQTTALGWTESFYRQNHFVFLLSKISLEINEMPGIGQPVRMEARGYGVYRSVFHRMISLHDETGKKLCEADHRWVLVDTETFKIIRRPPAILVDMVGEAPPGEQHSMELPKPAGELESMGEKSALVSMCDKFGHINNTHYADLVCDHIPTECLAQGPPKKMLLDFRREIKLGHSFSLSRGKVDENCYYFMAEGNGKCHFEAFAGF